ncbi:50S ribosomal protein L30 [Candidatus Woesearchaeota archaeon]|nr:50S ribosomal protein L30 [Candidatus Woesearchaeota archaeon]
MEQKPESGTKGAKQLAAVRVRGLTGIKTRIEDNLKMLRLYKKNYCCVLPGNAVYAGMLKKAKDYITWGEIDDETFNTLVNARGEEYNGRESDSKGKLRYNDFIVINNKKMKKYFRLNPPRKGFGRKGIKYSYQNGGALGYRGEAINDLIKRMI